MKVFRHIARLFTLCALAGLASSCATSHPRAQTAIGAPVPDVRGINQDGKTVNMKEACSGEWAVVFFYPRADTPG